jgi:predicted DNA-binding protein (MmcQ/YjbR family)
MNLESFYKYRLSKRGDRTLSFDRDTLCLKWENVCLILIKSMGKGEPSVNLKCEPERAQELRAQFDDIKPGWHMSKIHWNTVP